MDSPHRESALTFDIQVVPRASRNAGGSRAVLERLAARASA